ncbi:hypothetical protein [Gallaecimonas sp. GXIMD4217]|uniref:hypothetical protein n=1 Tax=Gallaecimonas sp. GXIMD4217 TaxID=3131927 RepID=UPI00311B2AD5
MTDYFWFSTLIAANALLLVVLAINVSRLRIRHGVSYGDGGNKPNGYSRHQAGADTHHHHGSAVNPQYIPGHVICRTEGNEWCIRYRLYHRQSAGCALYRHRAVPNRQRLQE